MATARSSSGGLPIFSLVLMTVVVVGLAALAVAFVLVTVGDSLQYVNGIANRYNQLTAFSRTLYYVQTKTLHYIAYVAGSPFESDVSVPSNPAADQAVLLGEIETGVKSISITLDSLLVGDSDGQNSRSFMTDRNDVVMEQALTLGGSGFDKALTAHDFIVRNADMTLLGMLEAVASDINAAGKAGSLSKQTVPMVMMNHMLVQHYLARIQETYSSFFNDYLDSALVDTKSICVGTPFVFSVVALVLCCCLIAMLSRVKTIIRYCVSFLAQIDFEVIAANNLLMDLLAGSFRERHEEMSSVSKAIREVGDHSDYIILEVSSDLTIRHASKAIESKLNLRPNDYTDISLPLVLSFEPSGEGVYENVPVTTIQDQKTIPMNISVVSVDDGMSEIYFFEDLTDRKMKELQWKNELNAIKQLKSGLVPCGVIGSLVLESGTWLYTAERIGIIASSFSGFDELPMELESVDKLKAYRSCLMDFVASEPALDHVKSAGITDTFAVNLSGQFGRSVCMDIETVKMARRMLLYLKEKGMTAGLGVTIESNVVVGMMNENVLSFDVYGRCMRISRVLAKWASPGKILIDKVQCPSVQQCAELNGMPQCSVPFGIAKFMCYECSLDNVDQLPNACQAVTPDDVDHDYQADNAVDMALAALSAANGREHL